MLSALLGVLLFQDGLTAEQFEKLHQELQPPKDEAWLSVPWKINLLEARDLAAAQKKPLMIWSMDGNPLAAG